MRKVSEKALSLYGRTKRLMMVFAKDPRAAKALMTWPKFSISSYSVVRRLVDQGIMARTVLDVGANTGQFAVAAAKLFPEAEVHCFEPVPECVYELRKNVAQLGEVRVHPYALGEGKNTLQFRVNSFSPSSSLLPLTEAHRRAFPGAHEERTIEVEVSTLDRVFDSVDSESPVLLKLDVQGYEKRVLRGGKTALEHVDYVVMEVSFKLMYEGEATFMELAKIMEGYGFRFERPVGWLSSPRTDEILQMDALFVRNE